MRLVPFVYPLRSIAVRWSSSLFSAVGIACAVGVFAGILSMQAGFEAVFKDIGATDVIIYLRPGATSEGESSFRDDQVDLIKKERPEIARDASGRPLAAAESFLAINLERLDGGTTNIPIRGIEELTPVIQAAHFRLLPGGRLINFGSDEILVGRPLVERIKNCRLGDSLTLNLTPFKVVGIFEHDGAYGSEIWGDVVRMTAALERPGRQRIIAKLAEGHDVARVSAALANDKRVPAKVASERDYLNSQKTMLGAIIHWLGSFITLIMSIGAILGATTTMMASVGSRAREVGILLATGFSRWAIMLTFLFESAVIGLLGGILGCLGLLPLHGLERGATNFQTFTEVTFAFQVTPDTLITAAILSVGLGLVGGVIPAWRAAGLVPTVALRRR